MKDKNQMYQKEEQGLLSTSEIAEIVECSESYVRQVIRGDRNSNKGKGLVIKTANELNIQGGKIAKTTIIEAIEKLIPFK